MIKFKGSFGVPSIVSFFSPFYTRISVKVYFLGHIFEKEILVDLHILVFLESENHIFSGCSACVYVTNIAQNRRTEITLNVLFYICIICRCYLKSFRKIDQKLIVQEHTK